MSERLAEFLNDPATRLAIHARALTRSFGQFVREAWEHATGFPYVHGKHVDVLVKHLEAVSRGEISRLLVNIPPSTSKSTIISVLWPAWLWTFQPDAEILCFSYSQQVAMRDSVACRELIRSQWYQSHFPNVQVSPDEDSKNFFRLTAGGSRRISTPETISTGLHPRYVIIDDPLSVDQAHSFAERQAVKIWYFESLSTRGMARDVAHVVCHQRLHPDDLSGEIVKHDDEIRRLYGDSASQWYHVMLPMRFDSSRAMRDRGYGGDWRTEPGQLLFPELLSESKIVSLERALGVAATSAQLQQLPRRSDSGIFKCSKLIKVTRDELPTKFRCLVRAWDLASTQDAGCYTAGILMGHYRDDRTESDRYYILDCVREQTSDPISLMQRTGQLDQRFYDGVRTFFEEQPGAAGKLLSKQIHSRLRGLSVKAVRPAGSKTDRADPFASAIAYGEVYVVVADWTDAFIDELEQFPGKFKDQVDASGLAYQVCVESPSKGLVTSDRSLDTIAPREQERCLNDGCNRPAFGDNGYCCDQCKDGRHSPQCCNEYSSWYVKQMPTETLSYQRAKLIPYRKVHRD